MKDSGYEGIDSIFIYLFLEQKKTLNVVLNKISGELNNRLLKNLLKTIEQNRFGIVSMNFHLNETKRLFGKI